MARHTAPQERRPGPQGAPPPQRFPSRIQPVHYVYASLLLFVMPVVASALAPLGVALFGLRRRIVAPLFAAIALMAAVSGFAVASSLWAEDDVGEILESTKFFIMALVFWLGLSLSVSYWRLRLFAAALFGAVFVWYVLFDFGLFRGEPLLYPPDFNNSMVLLSFLSLVIADQKGIFVRLALLALLFQFSVIADSRALLILAPLLLLRQPIRVSLVTFVLGALFIAGVVMVMARFNMFGSWSDIVRGAVLSASFGLIIDHGLAILGPGQVAFVQGINDNLPFFIAWRIDIQHAHNAFLHVAGSYGPLALACFVGFFLSLLRFARRIKSARLFNQVILVMLLMQLETVVSDIRLILIILLFLGLQTRNSHVPQAPQDTQNTGRAGAPPPPVETAPIAGGTAGAVS